MRGRRLGRRLFVGGTILLVIGLTVALVVWGASGPHYPEPEPGGGGADLITAIAALISAFAGLVTAIAGLIVITRSSKQVSKDTGGGEGSL